MTTTRTSRWLRAVAMLAAVSGVAVLAALWLLANLPLDHATFVVDGHEVAWRGFDAPQAAFAVLGVAVALIVAALVVSLIVVLALFAACLGIAIAFLASAAAVLISISPLLLIGWLIWRLVRGPANRPPASMPMSGSGRNAATAS